MVTEHQVNAFFLQLLVRAGAEGLESSGTSVLASILALCLVGLTTARRANSKSTLILERVKWTVVNLMHHRTLVFM